MPRAPDRAVIEAARFAQVLLASLVASHSISLSLCKEVQRAEQIVSCPDVEMLRAAVRGCDRLREAVRGYEGL